MSIFFAKDRDNLVSFTQSVSFYLGRSNLREREFECTIPEMSFILKVGLLLIVYGVKGGNSVLEVLRTVVA